MHRSFITAIAALAATLATPAFANDEGASEDDALVTFEMEMPADAVWKHSFDAYDAEAGKLNGTLRRALAFSKAMEREGVQPERVNIGIVVHGPSVFDVANSKRYAAKYDTGDTEFTTNPNVEMVAELIERGAEIWVCGFAAKHHKVGNVHLLDGVKMAPSGTVAHAELQRRGFGLNAY